MNIGEIHGFSARSQMVALVDSRVDQTRNPVDRMFREIDGDSKGLKPLILERVRLLDKYDGFRNRSGLSRDQRMGNLRPMVSAQERFSQDQEFHEFLDFIEQTFDSSPQNE